MIKPPLISLVYLTLLVNFQITLGLTRLNDCVALLNILPINLQQWHNLSHWELILNPLVHLILNAKTRSWGWFLLVFL